ncbi:MAG: hypothetical protein M0P12_03905 [Paludibacteraceae bacterium]|nr:hypothetical protein [Paludibacteraceae bacterium]
MESNNKKELPEYMNFSEMRKKGIEYLQKFSGKIWTDYNVHDPGVTILEVLCYALTDLGFRTSFKMKDLLTPKNDTYPEIEDSLIQAHEVLSCNPITVEDYRKLILEYVPGVRNVYFEREDEILLTGLSEISVNGFYKVLIELEDGVMDGVPSSVISDYCKDVLIRSELGKQKVDIRTFYKSYIRNLLLKYRNLCENIGSVEILDTVDVGICAQIEVSPRADFSSILNSFNKKMRDYVSPKLHYYTLSEMLEKGKTLDEIYQGVVPKYGFVDRNELENYERRRELYTSDVINILMNIDGVKSVPHLRFIHLGKDGEMSNCSIEDYKCSIKNRDCVWHWGESNHPVGVNIGNISLVMNGVDFPYDYSNVVIPEDKKEYQVCDFTYPVPEGKNKKTDIYYSVQNYFPKCYKLGAEGIMSSESDLRKAERLQLKAYMAFFDQLLIDYLMQLSSISKLLSWNKSIGNQKGESYMSYFYRTLKGHYKESDKTEIVGIEDVLNYGKDGEYESDYVDIDGSQKYSEVVDPDLTSRSVKKDRYDRMLDSLLARFNEEFVDYSIFKLKENPGMRGDDDALLVNTIDDKRRFLSNYVLFSAHRSQGFDYTEKWVMSDLEKRIMTKLGIDWTARPYNNLSTLESEKANASYDDYFGLHIIEHSLLLLPLLEKKEVQQFDIKTEDLFLKLSSDDMGEKLVKDPYSMQVTVVVPGWLFICKDPNFRIMVERVIRQEMPAHVSVKICWIARDVMKKFEDAFGVYMEALRLQPYKDIQANVNSDAKKQLLELIGVMNGFCNIYQRAKLQHPTAQNILNNECVRLGYTALVAPKVEVKTVEETIPVSFDFEFLAGSELQEFNDGYIGKVTVENKKRGDGDINERSANLVDVYLSADLNLDSADLNYLVLNFNYQITELPGDAYSNKKKFSENSDVLSFYASKKFSIANSIKTKNRKLKKITVEETLNSIELLNCKDARFNVQLPVKNKNYEWKDIPSEQQEYLFNKKDIPWLPLADLKIKISGTEGDGNLGVKGRVVCDLKITKTVTETEILD